MRYLLVGLCLLAAPAWADPLLPERDEARLAEMTRRAADWRNGAVVYQIMVDRFAPSRRLDQKSYPAPRKLHPWTDQPVAGPYLEKDEVWAHEVDFWGGDLDSLRGKLDYLQGLSVDVIYLNPIFESLTNHKYDAWDYHKVDPVYGSREELKLLADDLHQRKMRLMLDGVFNHMGRKSPMFKERPDFFKKTCWLDVDNLPELNLENPAVRDYLWGSRDSVVQSYLREEGIDGWRLDVAFDLGFRWLAELTRAAHEARPGSAIIGEIWNYPEDWYPAVDGVMNMHARSLILKLVDGTLTGPVACAMWETMLEDCGYDHILKAWIVLDNHDTVRLAHILKEDWQVRMARVLQFTLPGSPCIYYGSELGMTGGDDPTNRAPMAWDRTGSDNAVLALHRQLLKLRKAQPALRYGDFRRLRSERTFAFLRRTTAARETLIVLANPGPSSVKDFVQVREGKLQDLTPMRDLLGSPVKGLVQAGWLDVELPAHSVVVLAPETGDYPKGYNRYDRLP